MNTPFKCLCGSANCVYDIRGFKHLTRAQQEALLPRATPAIKELAVANAEVQLPPHLLSADGEGFLHAVAAIPVERVLLELSLLEPEPTQVRIGRYIIRHSEDSNCVLVEGRIVSCKALRPGESLTVNMNYFIYDMTVQFPNAYTATCKGFKHMDEALKQRYLYLCEPNVRAQAMRDGWIVKSTQDALVVRPNGDMGQTAYATRDIPVGTTLFHCTGLVVPFPTMYTICVGEGRHLLFGDAAECIAHHCDPNVRVAVNGDDSFDFITIKPIAKGEMVTFNYASTEWDMNTPFVCLCGSPACARTMQGFKYLSDVDRQRLWPITSDVVKRHCE